MFLRDWGGGGNFIFWGVLWGRGMAPRRHSKGRRGGGGGDFRNSKKFQKIFDYFLRKKFFMGTTELTSC